MHDTYLDITPCEFCELDDDFTYSMCGNCPYYDFDEELEDG